MTRSENSFAFKCFYQSDHPTNTGQTSFKDRNAHTQINVHSLFIYIFSLLYYRYSQPLGWTLPAGRRRHDGKHLQSAVVSKKKKTVTFTHFCFSNLYHEFKKCKRCHFLLTVTLVGLLPLIWMTVCPVELSTHESEPYSMLTGVDGGSRFTRWTIGLLAQPRDSDMALKPTSPLRGKENKIHNGLYICKGMNL